MWDNTVKTFTSSQNFTKNFPSHFAIDIKDITDNIIEDKINEKTYAEIVRNIMPGNISKYFTLSHIMKVENLLKEFVLSNESNNNRLKIAGLEIISLLLVYLNIFRLSKLYEARKFTEFPISDSTVIKLTPIFKLTEKSFLDILNSNIKDTDVRYLETIIKRILMGGSY